MKRFILYTFIAFTLPGCGGTEGRFRLKGEFDHLRQGEFYLYSLDGGLDGLDTIRLSNGKFDYETDLDGQATYYLMYPNLSEQVIFGASGDVVKVKGDARNLKSVEVTGSQANEDLTEFRLTYKDKSSSEIRKAASDFMQRVPASPVSVYLFKEYFLLPKGQVPEAEVKAQYRALCNAQPDNLQLLQWQDEVLHSGPLLKQGDSIPDFRLMQEDSTEIRISDYKGKPVLLCFWASWENMSSTLMYRIKRMLKESSGKVEVVCVSLDVNKAARKSVERMDSIKWVSSCDGLAWNSPVVTHFQIPYIPYCVFVDKEGKVLKTGDFDEKDDWAEIVRLAETK